MHFFPPRGAFDPIRCEVRAEVQASLSMCDSLAIAPLDPSRVGRCGDWRVENGDQAVNLTAACGCDRYSGANGISGVENSHSPSHNKLGAETEDPCESPWCDDRNWWRFVPVRSSLQPSQTSEQREFLPCLMA